MLTDRSAIRPGKITVLILKDSQIYEWLTDKDMAITDGDGV